MSFKFKTENQPENLVEKRQKTENGFIITYMCPACGERLAEIFDESGTGETQIIFTQDCDHYKWEIVGNKCFELGSNKDICPKKWLKKLREKSVLRLSEPQNKYFLLPVVKED